MQELKKLVIQSLLGKCLLVWTGNGCIQNYKNWSDYLTKKKRRHYKNPNGNMTIEDMIKIKHKGKIENFLRCFKLLKMPCPPKQLMTSSIRCFFCIDCFKHAFKKIKELKTCYKIKNKKYPKEDI